MLLSLYINPLHSLKIGHCITEGIGCTGAQEGVISAGSKKDLATKRNWWTPERWENLTSKSFLAHSQQYVELQTSYTTTDTFSFQGLRSWKKQQMLYENQSCTADKHHRQKNMFRKEYLLKLWSFKKILRPEMFLKNKPASPNFCLRDLFTSEAWKHEFQMQVKITPICQHFKLPLEQILHAALFRSHSHLGYIHSNKLNSIRKGSWTVHMIISTAELLGQSLASVWPKKSLSSQLISRDGSQLHIAEIMPRRTVAGSHCVWRRALTRPEAACFLPAGLRAQAHPSGWDRCHYSIPCQGRRKFTARRAKEVLSVSQKSLLTLDSWQSDRY